MLGCTPVNCRLAREPVRTEASLPFQGPPRCCQGEERSTRGCWSRSFVGCPVVSFRDGDPRHPAQHLGCEARHDRLEDFPGRRHCWDKTLGGCWTPWTTPSTACAQRDHFQPSLRLQGAGNTREERGGRWVQWLCQLAVGSHARDALPGGQADQTSPPREYQWAQCHHDGPNNTRHPCPALSHHRRGILWLFFVPAAKLPGTKALPLPCRACPGCWAITAAWPCTA